MAEVNNAETESVGECSVTSQIAEIKDSYEWKFNELQSKIDELKNLMMAMMEKSSNANAATPDQGSSKQPLRGSDNLPTDRYLLCNSKGTENTSLKS